MKQIIFVTGNKNKVREAKAIVGPQTQIVQRRHDLDEIQELDVKKIVAHKLAQAYAIYKQPVIVEDVSFEVKQWHGFPGPFIKWMENTITASQIPSLLRSRDRAVVYRVVYGYSDGNQTKFFQGIQRGSISKKAKGTDGFGFDSIFIPEGQRKTVAELGQEHKNKTSARFQALHKLKRFLSSESTL